MYNTREFAYAFARNEIHAYSIFARLLARAFVEKEAFVLQIFVDNVGLHAFLFSSTYILRFFLLTMRTRMEQTVGNPLSFSLHLRRIMFFLLALFSHVSIKKAISNISLRRRRKKKLYINIYIRYIIAILRTHSIRCTCACPRCRFVHINIASGSLPTF